ncbi:ERF family protein [Phascolarctobacterium succinatutens]|uniref:ERF family protein n=1 Tax=Phascolarctobacterium succinatutens TaxID=626940 RepID=UPI003AAE056A
MSVYEKLSKVQSELKAPKGQYNSFGKYKYRSCEDILEAVKPLNAKHGVVLTVSDEVVEISNRFYVKATATLVDIESGEKVTNTALAREDDAKKGMDGSQITGTASSYARKYCLNGLFCIDDTKDADTDEYRAQQERKPQENKPQERQYVKVVNGRTAVINSNGEYVAIENLTVEQLEKTLKIKQFAAAHEAIRRLLGEIKQ